MTGLNLETFLRLFRVAPGAWISLGVACLLLALLTWTGWGSRRALRKCLVLSIGAHLILMAYGGASPLVQRYLGLLTRPKVERPNFQRITVVSAPETPFDPSRPEPRSGLGARSVSTWDRAERTLAQADTSKLRPASPRPTTEPVPLPEPPAPDRSDTTAPAEPSGNRPEVPVAADPALPTKPDSPPAAEVAAAPVPLEPDPAAGMSPVGAADPNSPPPPAANEAAPSPVLGAIGRRDLRATTRPRPDLGPPSNPVPAVRPGSELAQPVAPALPAAAPALAESPVGDAARDLVSPPRRTEPEGVPTPPSTPPLVAAPAPPTVPEGLEPPSLVGPTAEAPPIVVASPAPASGGAGESLLPDLGGRRLARAGRPIPAATPEAPVAAPRPAATGADPDAGLLARVSPAGASALPSPAGPVGRRSISDVPPVYRSRLDPNRSVLAQRAGATPASEQAVERALVWLAEHQDADGRWDGAATGPADDSFTVHCPPGEVCLGDCRYAEADTALTGLALLAYLGAGYTHQAGKHQATVAKGLEFLRRSQKPDGDLRGGNTQVGMYCHSMATLALCEALALTGDPALRPPVERALDFLARSRAVDRMSWRYAPREAYGDTSILGWAVMALKSGRTVGIPIRPDIQAGIEAWLGRIASGPSGGLASYLPSGVPGNPADFQTRPTMTAEAWACRQFLELGGPGPRSDEAAAALLDHPTDGGNFNVYYLYYGTLAMFQHGGPAWTTWNARVRDQIVARQQTKGHKVGSWDIDDTTYGRFGGRLYCTAMATLTLEVYYRFLPLYAPTSSSPPSARGGATTTPPRDDAARRTRAATPTPARTPAPAPSARPAVIAPAPAPGARPR